MNKRLVWNFELNSDSTLQIPKVDNFVQSPHKWESRFFWSSDHIVTLHGLNDDFLKLSRYQIKHRHDTYHLLPNTDYNIKIRHNQLVYKPILMKKPLAMAYGKKIKLEESAPNWQLPGFSFEENEMTALISHIISHGVKINVEKETLTYKFETVPSTKLELAWLCVANKGYLSVSVESRSISLVEAITHQLLGDLPTSDYVTFLKGISNE